MPAGAVTSRTLGFGPILPPDRPNEGVFHVRIGSWTTVEGALVIANDRYGPIDAAICREWFSVPVRYRVTFGGIEG